MESTVTTADIAPNTSQTVFIIVVDGAANEGNVSRIITHDATAPASIVEAPADGVFLNALSGILGTASDMGGSRVALVEVSIFDGTNYHNGTGFSSAIEVWLSASSTESWSYNTTAVVWTSGSSYVIKSRATDEVGNVETPSAGILFYCDSEPPSSTILVPVDGARLFNLDEISGTATDTGSSSLASVSVSIFDGTNYYNGTGFSSVSAVWLPAIGTDNWSIDTTGIAWSFGKSYTVKSRAVDGAGNQETPGAGASFTVPFPPVKKKDKGCSLSVDRCPPSDFFGWVLPLLILGAVLLARRRREEGREVLARK